MHVLLGIVPVDLDALFFLELCSTTMPFSCNISYRKTVARLLPSF
jgi:hypothetical protein